MSGMVTIPCRVEHFRVGQVMWLYNSKGKKCGAGVVVSTNYNSITIKAAPWYTTLRLWLRDRWWDVKAEYQIWRMGL